MPNKCTAYDDHTGSFADALLLTKLALAKSAKPDQPLRKAYSRKVVSLSATSAFGDQFIEAGTGDFGAAVTKAVQPERAMLLYSGQLGERPV